MTKHLVKWFPDHEGDQASWVSEDTLEEFYHAPKDWMGKTKDSTNREEYRRGLDAAAKYVEKYMVNNVLGEAICWRCGTKRKIEFPEDQKHKTIRNWECSRGWLDIDSSREYDCTARGISSLTSQLQITLGQQPQEFFEEMDLDLIVQQNEEVLIGDGAHGRVFKVLHNDGFKAVKRFPRSIDGKIPKNFTDELAAFVHLRHDNIICIFGVQTALGKSPAILMEYCEFQGNDDSVTIHKRGAIENRVFTKILLRTRLALDICDGMCHVHKMKVMHRDLKPDNILISSKNVDGHLVPCAKICDFSISRLAKGMPVHSSAGKRRFSLYKAAKEIDGSSQLSSESDQNALCKADDVYSFGWILAELISGRLSEWNSLEDADLHAKVTKGERDRSLFVSDHSDRLILQSAEVIADMCWQHKWSLRPEFDKLCTLHKHVR